MDQTCDDWIFIPAAAKAPSSHPLAIPDFHRPYRPRHIEPQLALGGLPVPKPKPRPKSVALQLSQFPPNSAGVSSLVHPTQFQGPPVSQPTVSKLLQPPRERKPHAGQVANSLTSQLLRLKNPSQSKWLTSEWHRILSHLDQDSTVFQALKSSAHPQAHASRILDQFAPSTLLRYFSAWNGFQKTLVSLNISIANLTESHLADALITVSLSKKSECSAGCQATIKAIRWISTHAGVSALQIAWNPMIESFLKSCIPKELKESIPLSLYVMAQLERRILMSSCTMQETVVIGAILACTWAGLRFADAQRCSFSSFCYDGASLRFMLAHQDIKSRPALGYQSIRFPFIGNFQLG